MNFSMRTAAAVMLAASLALPSAFASDPAPAAKDKKHAATKKAKPAPKPTVEDQINALRQELQGQINSLKGDLAQKDAQLKQAQQAAADAQASAAKAEAASNTQAQAVTENAAAVGTLQNTVNDLKANSVSLAATVSDETAKIKKDIANPTALHYKGINLTPGGFLAAETAWRAKATGGDIPTAFSALPYEGADAYKLSEFFGSARQSRITLLAEGKMPWGTMKGYYEADFLGAGTTSNNNQSNSYVMRQRVLYAQAETNTHWSFTGGQLWSLSAEQKKGITANPGDVATPLTIDVNYVAGFVYTRQYGFRVAKNSEHYAFGVAVENPQLIYSPTLAGNTPYAVVGSAGANGGNYNAAITGFTATTYVQNYIPESGTPTYLPVYNTVTVASNAANLSFNYAPDMLVKVTADQPWGHFEAFGIGRFAHETVYLDATTDRIKYGGQADIAGFNGGKMGGSVVAKADSKNAISNTIALGGVGGSARLLLMDKKVTLGAKGLWGTGLGRYGATGLPDLTNNDWGGFSPLHSVSGIGTVEINATPRLVIYANYGGDYVGRNDWSRSRDTTLGSPTATFCPLTAASAADCSSAPTVAQLAAGGTWGGHWSIPKQAAVGYGSRFLSTSSCASTTTPGYNSGSSNGYVPGGSCSAQTRNVQEGTIGYWYDIYKGDRGRLRQSIQYGYTVREGWSTNDSTMGLKGINNMLFTSFRYYLP